MLIITFQQIMWTRFILMQLFGELSNFYKIMQFFAKINEFMGILNRALTEMVNY